MNIPVLPAIAYSIAALSMAACTQTEPANAPLTQAAAAIVVGEPVSCVNLTSIHDTKAWDDRTIDFVMNNGTRYRNALPYRCATLGFEQRFGYKTTTSQLCSSDTITVLPTGSSIPGPTCSLGEFVPVRLGG